MSKSRRVALSLNPNMEQSDFTRQFVADHLGIDTDDPCFQYVLTQLFGTKRRGFLPTDLNALRRFVAHARDDYHAQVERQRAKRAKCWVYYLQVGEYIKIGTAQNLRTRLNQYPPSAVLLAVEPGSYDLEGQRLGQFAEHLAARKEWFHPHADLLAHIESIRDEDALTAALDRRTAV